MVVNRLYNWSYWYSNHNSKIKYIDSTIKYIDFKSIYYAIDLDEVTFFYDF